MSSSVLSGKAGYDLFVYGSLQDPQVLNVVLNRVPDSFFAKLSGLYVSLSLFLSFICLDLIPYVLRCITEDELKILDEFEDVEYDRKTVQVVIKDTLDKMQVETYVWKNKDDPDLYGEWDFEEWKRHDKEGFVIATKKFMEERKSPEAKTRMDTFKTFFKHDDIENGKVMDS
ncbi:unnamed protein product [Cochlearia groenlandica]